MNVINQLSHTTGYNRYPTIFGEIQQMLQDHNPPPTILSFGCSTGEEVMTLHNKYFPHSQIMGYDIDESIIKTLNRKNTLHEVHYCSNVTELSTYDICFCMSVLCRWPESMGPYTFAQFESTVKQIDELINPGGYLCIYNSKYLLLETVVGHKYNPVEPSHSDSGTVTKYSHDGNIVTQYPYYLFHKISDATI
jgi:2-polyprenyl-3-methyl-5-hydroxy-6-metoxy-1,4-benzoquinol methylase